MFGVKNHSLCVQNAHWDCPVATTSCSTKRSPMPGTTATSPPWAVGTRPMKKQSNGWKEGKPHEHHRKITDRTCQQPRLCWTRTVALISHVGPRASKRGSLENASGWLLPPFPRCPPTPPDCAQAPTATQSQKMMKKLQNGNGQCVG
jgi:hypothetical protein